MQLASYLERGPLIWMMPLHLHVNKKSDYDMMILYIALQFYIKTSKVISNVFDYISKVIVIVIITFLQVL